MRYFFEMLPPTDLQKPHESLLTPNELTAKMIGDGAYREIKQVNLHEISILPDGSFGIGFDYMEQNY